MERRDVQIKTRTAQETFNLGKKFVSSLKEGDVIALYGELGSGKTVFVQGACAGLGVTKEVTSPSFIIMHEYSGKFMIYHFDFYRISSLTDIESIDIQDYFYGDGISFIEWPEIAETLFPSSTFKIYFKRSFKDNKVVEKVRMITISFPPGRKVISL